MLDEGAVLGTGAALHAGIPVSDRADFFIEGEDLLWQTCIHIPQPLHLSCSICRVTTFFKYLYFIDFYLLICALISAHFFYTKQLATRAIRPKLADKIIRGMAIPISLTTPERDV